MDQDGSKKLSETCRDTIHLVIENHPKCLNSTSSAHAKNEMQFFFLIYLCHICILQESVSAKFLNFNVIDTWHDTVVG